MTILDDAAPSPPADARVQPSADVAGSASIGRGVVVWHLAQVREGARLGDGCTIGRGAYIGPDVVLGRNCKVQNHALVYEPARLADGVFIGPAAVLTNDEFPRAVNPDGSLMGAGDWHQVGVTMGTGASVGARAVCIAPVRSGDWAMVAAGAVVTRDVAPHQLVAGNPARHHGWVCECGEVVSRAAERPADVRCPGHGRGAAEDRTAPA